MASTRFTQMQNTCLCKRRESALQKRFDFFIIQPQGKKFNAVHKKPQGTLIYF